ncbi:uncharacterized protein [Nicotiana tomentosiformis]|uniref:uncharacterized protein n=1 Tax=Nicotiana tomentosiformis TaxID=4098 RepID=UPI00388C8635
MDSCYSKHMSGSTNDFLSLKAMLGWSVSFGNGKKGYILRIGRIGKFLSHSIENGYYVNGWKYDLLSVSQICDKGNRSGDLSCLSVVDDNAELWHRRLGHASFTLLNKLVKKDLVRGLLNSSFKDHKSIVPGEVIDMANGKTDMMSHVKDSNDNGTSESPTTEAENIVANADQGTPHAERESHSEIPGPSHNKVRVSNWKHKSSHPLENVITPLDSGIQTRSKARLVVQGYNQEEGIDYDETFTPVSRMKKPPGFESHEHPEHVFKLDKALYGLTQAPRACCERLSKFLLENGLTRGKIDNTLFLKKRGRNVLIVQVTLTSQQKYIKELLKRFDMEASKVIDTPIATATHLDMDEPGSPVNQTMFQSNPKESHLKAAKRILRYLKETQDLVLYYSSGDNLDLIGYVNADYAAYLVDRKSTSDIFTKALSREHFEKNRLALGVMKSSQGLGPSMIGYERRVQSRQVANALHDWSKDEAYIFKLCQGTWFL